MMKPHMALIQDIEMRGLFMPVTMMWVGVIRGHEAGAPIRPICDWRYKNV